MEHKSVRWLVRFISVFLLFVCLLLFLKLKPLWAPILEVLHVLTLPLVLAFLLAYILHPLVVLLTRIGMKRIYSILLVFFLLIVLGVFTIYIALPKLMDQAVALKESLPIFIQTYDSFIQRIAALTANLPSFLQEKITDGIRYLEGFVVKGSGFIFHFLSMVVQNIFVLLLVPFIAYYMLRDYDRGVRRVLLVTPISYRGLLSDYVVEIDDCIGKYIRSQLLVSLIVGGISTVAFYILGLDYALVFGLIIAITNIIPYFGPIIGAIPVLLFALTISKKAAIMVLIIILAIQFIEGSVLGPMITGKTISMHPVTIILLLLVGGEIWGILGMIFIIPVFAFLKITIQYIKQFYQVKKQERPREMIDK